MKLVAGFAVFLIRGYQRVLSPLKRVWLGPGAGCRFVPTCSEYALQCFKLQPAHRAAWLSARRIARCHPWGGSGYDPPPGSEAAFPDAIDAAEESDARPKPKSLRDLL